MQSLSWAVDYDIPWQSWGVFKLIPEHAAGLTPEQQAEHVYSGIRIAGTTIDVTFDRNNMK
eukprot:9972522-Alexandrium_andersonii.AAC.1